MSNIVQFGTFDVNNYGDLLFPLLAQQELRRVPNVVLTAVSPVGGKPADLQDCASCCGYYDLVETAHTIDGALIGGGNIIHCTPSRLAAYVAAGRGSLAYGDLWIGPAFFLPEHVPVVWNAPGVPAPFSKLHHQLVKTALQRANYLSVRDEMSRQFLLDVWSQANISVVPDPAWAIDRLWNRGDLKSVYESVFTQRAIHVPERSVLFHLNRRYLGDMSIDAVAQRLDSIAKEMFARPILIAFAGCHADDILVREVGALMATSPVIMDNVRSLREVAACIAFSEAYAGSSMHGFITASAFGIPGVCVANKAMPKFAGIISLMGESDVVVEGWDRARETLRSMDVDKRKNELITIRDSAHRALEVHWKRIRAEIEKPVKGPKNVARGPALHSLLEYQNQAVDALLALREEEHRAKQRSLEVMLRKEIKGLTADYAKKQKETEAKVKKIKRSFSWRVTRPLRAASQKFPRVGTIVFNVLRAIVRFAERKSHPGTDVVSWPSRTMVADSIQKIQMYQASARKGTRKIVFYTAVFGEYDNLLLPGWIDENIDYVCFSDRPRNTYGVWQIRASPYFHNDPVRVARFIKTHPHQLFHDYEVAIWLDANIVMRGDLRRYIDILEAENTSLGLIPHPHRNCFYEEAEACKRLHKDKPSVIDAQVNYYRNNGLKELTGLFETGFMVIRLADHAVSSMFQSWWAQIEKFSRRDQLGLAWALDGWEGRVSHLLPKGVSVREDDDFIYYTHQMCQRLVVPPQLLEMGQLKNALDNTPFRDVKEARLSIAKDIPIDIVVCVFNALDDVQLCLESVRQHLLPRHKIIVVNDCSNGPTTNYLRSFAAGDERVFLIENEKNLGYTQSANVGLAAGTAAFRIMLNSDTVVCENWAIKLLDVAMQRQEIGIVGPLSNAAGAQSVPEIKGSNKNTAVNTIPSGVSSADIDRFLEEISLSETMPDVPLVHGFCFGIKKTVIDKIGLFDAVNFARYYGEENDYCFRAAAAGFRFAIATNTFVFHRKSRSIDEEERIVHMGAAGKKLRELYGRQAVREACLQMEQHPLLENIRTRVQEWFMERGIKSTSQSGS